MDKSCCISAFLAFVASQHGDTQYFGFEYIPYTWTPKVCKIMALMAVFMGLGLVFYILLGFRYYLPYHTITVSIFFSIIPL